MLIKEYRIPMPLSVQEYRIAQLYMIQKKSREESQGTESGVEIIQNKPYEDGPGGSGQYTQKIYHISKHIPGWLVAILPKDALIVEEEAWNAYPYTRTRYTCPFIEKFSIDIETRYFDDTGEKENVFDLPKSDFGRRIVDEIDLVNEQSSDYKKEEDPRHYVSKKTGRGPLSEDWLSIAKKSSPKSRGNFMCAYKQCKVEFKYWGMQSKIEKFIHDTGLRKVMLRAHKQAWCWQDEWHGLTINDIRRLEKETQLALQIKFGVNTSDSDNTLDLEESENNVENNSFSQTNLSSRQTGKKVLHKQSSNISSHSNHSKHSSLDGKHFNFYWEINNILKAVLKCSDISSDDEFFDAQGKFVCLLRLAAHSKTKTSTCFIIFYTDSLRSMVHENSLDHELLLDQVSILKYRRKVINIIMLYFFFVTNNVFQHYSANPCQVSVLLLVLHGGNGLEASNQGLHSTKQSDVHTLQSTLEAVMKSYYKSVYGRLAVRLVSCPAICTEAYHLLQRLIPTSHNDSTQHTISSAMLSIFGTSSPKYMDTIRLLACSCNFVYNNFILSSEGKGFNGQVCIISDTMGSVLAYDLLCSAASNDSISQSAVFSNYAPSNVPKYHLFPLGDGQSISLGDILSTSREFTGSIDTGRRSSEWSVGSGQLDLQLSGNLAKIASHWWGEKRIDFSLFSPDVIGGFPSASLPHLFHSSFWESADVAAFLLRQIFQYEHMHYQTSNNTEIQFTQTFPTEKWLRKRTNVKLRNLTANHRCRDSVALECTPQVLVGRFMYGPLDMLTLTGEKVDIYIMTPPPASEWVYMDTEICNNSGKVTYNIPESKSLTQGLYPVKMIVRGDHTSADSNLAVLCPQTECVIFSIDGSFTASMSIMGSDPKVRPGAVDVVRLWQDLGYLIIYVTGRPDMQKHRVVTWLAQHNFPHGMIWFGDGLSKDPLKQKTILLKNLKTENKLIYAAGYGSSKDIAVYSQLDIEPDRIFIVGKVSKKQSHQ
uniref:DDHD domain-containing protein n=1 Tax=Ciona savignyi TaxID=51511 RepID=H2Y8N7_CIOSA